MKRFISILAVMAMCLSLCACGKSESNSVQYQKYQTIIDNLENGNYQNAIDLIENMAKQDDPTPNTGAATEPTKPALTPEQIAWKADAVGTWIPSKSAEEDGHTGFTVKADGTCTVDGKNYTWEIGHSSKNLTQITVLDGQTKVHMLQISIDSDYGYKGASLFTFTDANNAQVTNGTYYRNEDYTVVEITNDNWQDYFEIKEVVNVGKNAFGEVDTFRSQSCFRLKNAESTVNSALSSGGVEYKYLLACQDATVDVTNLTYTVSAIRNTSVSNNTTELGHNTDPKNTQYYGVSIGGFVANNLDKDETDTVWRPTDIEILRVQATLFIAKK